MYLPLHSSKPRLIFDERPVLISDKINLSMLKFFILSMTDFLLLSSETIILKPISKPRFLIESIHNASDCGLL